MKHIKYDQFVRALNIISAYRQQIREELDEVEKMIIDAKVPEIKRRDELLYDCDISVRLHNLLHVYCDDLGMAYSQLRISDLENVSLKSLKLRRGFGNSSLDELSKLCNYANVKLKP